MIALERFAAVIFDMDGVLVDGEPLHFAALNELLAPDGIAVTFDQYRPYMGTKAGWRDMAIDFGLASPPETYSARYSDLVLANYRNAEPLPGAHRVVEGLREAGVPVGLASSSRRPWVEACLETIGLDGHFDAIVTGSDVERGKPDPEIYLLAAERLGVNPVSCLAIEDAPAGIEAAHAAGMECWAVRTEYTRGLDLPGPGREYESLEEIDLADILGVAA